MSEYMLKDELLKQLDELDEEISLSLSKRAAECTCSSSAEPP